MKRHVISEPAVTTQEARVLHYVPWQWLTKRQWPNGTLLKEPFLLEQDFYSACAACCWDTVLNPGLIAMPSVYCVNRRSHSKSKFDDREHDFSFPETYKHPLSVCQLSYQRSNNRLHWIYGSDLSTCESRHAYRAQFSPETRTVA